MEQILISATTSAEAATSILSRAQRDAGRHADANVSRSKRTGGRRARLEWLDLVAPPDGGGGRRLETHLESQLEGVDLDSLTSVERRLLARYRAAQPPPDDDDPRLHRPSSLPSASYLSRAPFDPLSRPRPDDGGDAPPVMLEGGSYAVPYLPSDRSSTTHSSAPSSPSAAAAHPHVPSGWAVPKSAALGGGGLKHAIKEADEAAQVLLPSPLPSHPRQIFQQPTRPGAAAPPAHRPDAGGESARSESRPPLRLSQ